VGLYNETLQGRFNEVIRRLHGMKSTPAPQVSPEILHGVILENDRAEHHFLHTGQLWATGNIVAPANAGTFSSIGVLNPANSGLLVTIVGGILDSAAGAAVAIGQLSSTLIPAGTNQPAIVRDSRFTRKTALGVTGRWQNSYVAGTLVNALDQVRLVIANQQYLINVVPLVLGPGGSLDYQISVVNVGIEGVFWGYARPITPEETSGG
jgi:hypothetical protein